MTDKPDQSAKVPGVDEAVEKLYLEELDINGMLQNLNSVDCWDIRTTFLEKINNANVKQESAIRLLIGLTSFTIVPNHPKKPFQPFFISGNRRATVPTDLLPEQIDTLAEIAPKIANAGLRARVADVVWFVKRSRHDMADLAISSYCECVEQIIDRKSVFAFGDQSPWGRGVLKSLTRAVTIKKAARAKSTNLKILRDLILNLINTAYTQRNVNGFVRLANLILCNNLAISSELATNAESLAQRDEFSAEPELRHALWESAARHYKQNADTTNQNRCIIEAAECIVQRTEFTTLPAAKLAYFEDAIKMLQTCPDTKTRREKLMSKMRDIQPLIPTTYHSTKTQVDLTEQVESAQEIARGKPWPIAFYLLAICDQLPDRDTSRQAAKQYVEKSPISATIPVTGYDGFGRKVFQSPGLYGNSRDDEEHFRYLISFRRGISRQLTAFGTINPIRQIVSSEHLVTVELILEMINDSQFIPPDRKQIFARGICRFLAGDDFEAAHLLVPQLENSLRYILTRNGINVSLMNNYGIYTDASLSMLLSSKKNWRAELEKMLPNFYIDEIDSLFNYPGGPSLRNVIAHGKMAASGAQDYSLVYGIWLIIHLAIILSPSTVPTLQQYDSSYRAK